MRVLVLVFLATVAGWLPLSSFASSGFCLTSPDQPAIWYNRTGDKVHQELVGS